LLRSARNDIKTLGDTPKPPVFLGRTPLFKLLWLPQSWGTEGVWLYAPTFGDTGNPPLSPFRKGGVRKDD
jgi:hypothetical protein